METIRLNKAEFNNVLQMASQMAGVSKTLPILDNVHLRIKDGTLQITSSDSEVTITKGYQLLYNTSEDCDIIFNPKSLCALLPIIADEEIDVENNGSDILVKYSNGDMSLPTFDVDDFPILDLDAQNAKSVTIEDCAGFAETIKNASSFIANDYIRPIMTAIVVHIAESGIEIYASDANILYFSKFSDKGNQDEKFILLPAKAIKPIYSLLKYSSDKSFTLLYNDTHAKFVCDGGSVTTRIMEGKYPNVKSVVPQTSKTDIIFDKKTIQDAIKRVSLSTNESKLGVFSINFDEAEISAGDADFRKVSKEVVEANIQTGQSLRIGFNLQKLSRAISVIDGPQITMCANDKDTATLWHNSDDNRTLVLVMPMRIE